MQMVENFQGKGHHLYMDNFYTSPTLFSSLLHVGIGACGTLRCNRIGVPTSIKNPPTKLKKGDIISKKKREFDVFEVERQERSDITYDFT